MLGVRHGSLAAKMGCMGAAGSLLFEPLSTWRAQKEARASAQSLFVDLPSMSGVRCIIHLLQAHVCAEAKSPF